MTKNEPMVLSSSQLTAGWRFGVWLSVSNDWFRNQDRSLWKSTTLARAKERMAQIIGEADINSHLAYVGFITPEMS